MRVLVLHGNDEHGPAGRGFVMRHRWEVTLEEECPTLGDVMEAFLEQAEVPDELAGKEEYLHVLPLFDLAERAEKARRGGSVVREGDRFRLLCAAP